MTRTRARHEVRLADQAVEGVGSRTATTIGLAPETAHPTL
jgi:hypothetical protein